MKAAIFDLDGVVVYTDAYHYEGWKRLADEHGWDFDESLNDQLRGVSRLVSLDIILRHNGVDIPEEQKVALANRKNDYYRELLKGIDESAVVAGAREVIEALRKRGVRIALGSSSKNATTVLDALSLTPLFDAVVTGSDITRSKPDPEIFLLGAERLGLDPADCAVFEDAPSGVDAALAAGMTAIGFGPTEGLDHAHLRVLEWGTVDLDALIAQIDAAAGRAQ